jgi:hypothetical protein
MYGSVDVSCAPAFQPIAPMQMKAAAHRRNPVFVMTIPQKSKFAVTGP